MPDDLVLCGTYTDPSRQAGFEVTPDNPVMGMTGPTRDRRASTSSAATSRPER